MTLRFYSHNNIPVGHTAVLMWSSCGHHVHASLVLAHLIAEGLHLSATFWRYAFMEVTWVTFIYLRWPTTWAHITPLFLVMVAEMEGQK